MAHDKLSPREVWLLLFIAERCGLCGRMGLKPRHRANVVGLWRRHLVEIWYRCAPDEGATHGPYFSLTVDGHHLAMSILAGREAYRQANPQKFSAAPRIAA
jgi:hypothetical protein